MSVGQTHVSAKFYVYVHCRPDGTPFYVGKGQGKRAYEWVNGRNKHHRHITAKYGSANIGIHLFPCLTETEAFADEIARIAQLRADGYKLANLTDGGEGPSGAVQSPETIAKKVAALIGGKRTDEQRARMSQAMAGIKRKPLTAEHRVKLAEISRGNKHRLGIKSSPETIAKCMAGIQRALIDGNLRERRRERMIGNQYARKELK
jgi:hypothetical protein